MTDLVLCLNGGKRDGELIPVSTTKCFLAMDEQAGTNDTQFAIFRGPHGAAAKSYSNDIQVNGTPLTVHWLKEGDRIEFPNSIVVEVTQLGWVEDASDETESEQHDNTNKSADDGEFVNPDVYQCEELDTDLAIEDGGLAQAYQSKNTTLPSTEDDPELVNRQETSEIYEETEEMSVTSNEQDQRIEMIENQINEIQTQNEQAQQRFDQIDGNLTLLTEQLSQLVTIASNNATQVESSFVAQPESVEETEIAQETEEQFVTFGSDEPLPVEVTTEEPAYGDFNSAADVEEEKIVAFDPQVSEPEMETALNVETKDVGFERDTFETASTSQTADEQPSESFDQTHSQNENVDSFAEPTSLETEPTNETTFEESSFASQLTQPAEEAPIEEAPAEEAPTNEVVEEPVEEVQQEVEDSASKNESVADVLARMQATGQWDGVPDDGDEESPVAVETPAVPEPVVEQPVESGDAEEDVNDYMSQLLSRMRGDEPSSQAPAVAPVAAKPTAEVQQPEEKEVFVPPVNPLTEKDFKPKQKAKQIGSLSAMRELANSTARSAVKKSEDERRKALGYLQLGIAGASFVMAGYYLLVASQAFFDTGCLVGMVCLGVSGFLTYRYYSTMKRNELLGENAAKEDQSEETEAELTEPVSAAPTEA